MFASGAIAWTGVSVAVVFGATVFNELDQPLVRTAGPLVLLIAMAAAQLSSRAIARIAPRASGVLLMSAGVTGILTGAWLRADTPAIAGFALLGAGTGIAYRATLVALTHGATPARQGALASLYAAITYTVAATVVLVVGWIGNMTGLIPATVATLAALGVSTIVLAAWTPRSRDTISVDGPHTHRGDRKEQRALWVVVRAHPPERRDPDSRRLAAPTASGPPPHDLSRKRCIDPVERTLSDLTDSCP
jgi:hypothetical protein